MFEGQNTILVLIRGNCLEKSSKPVPQEGRVLFALGDKRTGGQLGRRGRNLNTMHIPLMKSEQNLWYMTHKHFYSLVLRVGCVAAGSSSAQNMTAHVLGRHTLEAVGEGRFSVRWALEAGDSGTRLPTEWGGP